MYMQAGCRRPEGLWSWPTRKFLIAGIFLIIAVAGCAGAKPSRYAARAIPNQKLGAIDRMNRQLKENNSDKELKRRLAHPQAQAQEPVHSLAHPLQWPLSRIKVTSGFGKRGRDVHEGLDLAALPGTPVFAAQEGRVLYAGNRIQGYGKMIVIKHGFDKLTTVYAHNSKLLVKKGDEVRKGQKIAVSGSTGRTSGPHLHFEIRRGIAAVDPKLLLPPVKK